jgi:hypothetical protein
VVVDDNHLVRQPVPLPGEHADRGRAAADPHPLLGGAIDDRRGAGGDLQLCAIIDREFDRLAVGEVEQRLARCPAGLLAAAGEVVDAAEGEHLRAVLARRNVPDRLAAGAHEAAFRADEAVGVDLHLHPAIAEDSLGDDRHHVDAVHLRGDDERRGLVVGIGRARADGGDERRAPDDVPVPRLAASQKRHQLSALVRVPVARAGHPVLDVAEHRTGVAANTVVARHRRLRSL